MLNRLSGLLHTGCLVEEVGREFPLRKEFSTDMNTAEVSTFFTSLHLYCMRIARILWSWGKGRRKQSSTLSLLLIQGNVCPVALIAMGIGQLQIDELLLTAYSSL